MTTDEAIAAMRAGTKVIDSVTGQTGYIVGWWGNGTCFFSLKPSPTGLSRNPQELTIADK